MIEKLISDTINLIIKGGMEKIPQILLICQNIAVSFNDYEDLYWIKKEIEGYSEDDEVPEYRKVPQRFIGQIPYFTEEVKEINGKKEKVTLWNNRRYDYYETIPFRFPIQSLLRKKKTEVFSFDHPVRGERDDESHRPHNFTIKIDFTYIDTILSSVMARVNNYLYGKIQNIKKYAELNTYTQEHDNIRIEELLIQIFNRFTAASKELEKQRKNKELLEIHDEDDVQFILNAFLTLHFEVEKEYTIPSTSGKTARIDFFLPSENKGIEVKNVSKNNSKKIVDEILADISLYQSEPRIHELYFFIFDPDHHINSRKKFIQDIEKLNKGRYKKLRVIIKPYFEKTTKISRKGLTPFIVDNDPTKIVHEVTKNKKDNQEQNES